MEIDSFVCLKVGYWEYLGQKASDLLLMWHAWHAILSVSVWPLAMVLIMPLNDLKNRGQLPWLFKKQKFSLPEQTQNRNENPHC